MLVADIISCAAWATGARMRNGNNLHLFGNNFPMETECESRRVMRVGRQRQVGIED